MQRSVAYYVCVCVGISNYIYIYASGDHPINWNDTEKISMAPAQR